MSVFYISFRDLARKKCDLTFNDYFQNEVVLFEEVYKEWNGFKRSDEHVS
jgi:hypothetical protein